MMRKPPKFLTDKFYEQCRNPIMEKHRLIQLQNLTIFDGNKGDCASILLLTQNFARSHLIKYYFFTKVICLTFHTSH